ncbi:MAG: Maf family protein [marine benthic group bacterium]|nr:Maf family protein [Gemmatimonadota bacterium]
MRLVLASGSPRRREILQLLGLHHEIRPPEVDERLRSGEEPGVQARRLAVEKASSIAGDGDDLILAADTLVVLGEEILGKPADEADASTMLMKLQGRQHAVHTGLALRLGDRIESDVAVTRVWFRSLDAAECEEYVATSEPLDKAGAYGIQGLGAVLVQRIEGEYFNVMGLPVQLLLSLLARFGLRYAYGSLEEV